MLDDKGRLAHGELTSGNGIIMLASPTMGIKAQNIIARLVNLLLNGIKYIILLTLYWYMLTISKSITKEQKSLERFFSLT
jgi:hypothetical protein